MASPPAMPSEDEDRLTQVNVSTWNAPSGQQTAIAPHARAAEILRQVEWYFSDDNLPNDAHLLGFTGREGTNPVNIGLIMSFRKMKEFKPKSAVREALRISNLVEVVDNNHIRRRFPLTKPLTVVPKFDEKRHRKEVALAANPHLTKNMLKPTGFEADAVEEPLTEKERDLYDSKNSFIDRITTAIKYFGSKRKMHQNLHSVFQRFLLFGGFEGGAHMFQGGMTKEELKKEGLTPAQIKESLEYYGVATSVQEAMAAQAEDASMPIIFVVDFEALAKAFFSTEFMASSEWCDDKVVKTGVQVVRSFYQYLLLHEVCPEYEDQLRAALRVCDLAEVELVKLATIDRCLPGAFSAACSTVFGGSYKGLYRSAFSAAPDDEDGGWIYTGDNFGLADDHARFIFGAGLAGYGTDVQYEKANAALKKEHEPLKVAATQQMGLEVISIIMPDDNIKAMYEELNSTEVQSHQMSFIDPMGKMVCRRWAVPYAAPVDLPKDLLAAFDEGDTVEFIVEAEVLTYCYPGLKIDCLVKELDIGLKWIDTVDAVYPSFHTALPNLYLDDKELWKKPGPPKGWMERQNAKKKRVSHGALVPVETELVGTSAVGASADLNELAPGASYGSGCIAPGFAGHGDSSESDWDSDYDDEELD